MDRIDFSRQISSLFEITPVAALLGPRQCGKTTLARQYAQTKLAAAEEVTFFDLEDPVDLRRLENPKLALAPLSGLIVIDEIQRRPDLFPVLRVLVDQDRDRQRYLILGSASRELIKQSSETLAGRISHLELTPFQLSETQEIDQLWLRGGFPPAYLARSNRKSLVWRTAYIRTFLEQDIPALGFNIPSHFLRRFWMMLSHYHGQIFNASQLGRLLNLSHNTIKKYLDLLCGTFMMRSLKPWHANVKKRQVKSPKIYFRDSGILHALWRVAEAKDLRSMPQLGASWEGFALEEVIRSHMPAIDGDDCYFWATQGGAELDLLIVTPQGKIGYEFKYQDAPSITKSMRIALEDLQLESLKIVYPGDKSFQMADKIWLTSLRDLIASQKLPS